MEKTSKGYQAGYRAGVATVLRDWRHRSRLVLLAIWIGLCLPVGLYTVIMRADNVRYYIPLVLGTVLLAYLHLIIDADLRRKLAEFDDAPADAPRLTSGNAAA